jgi:hypothetical protein
VRLTQVVNRVNSRLDGKQRQEHGKADSGGSSADDGRGSAAREDQEDECF